MGYGSKGLNDLRDEAYGNSKAHGFHDNPKSFGDDIALIHSEVSEALEDFRNGHAPTKVWYQAKDGWVKDDPHGANGEIHKPCGIPSELADIIIRVLDLSGKHGIDIEQAVREKMMHNESRPHMHGKTL